jgi:hypothetical protein
VRERDQSKYVGVNGRIILKMYLRKIGWEKTWTTFIWLRMGKRGGLL